MVSEEDITAGLAEGGVPGFDTSSWRTGDSWPGCPKIFLEQWPKLKGNPGGFDQEKCPNHSAVYTKQPRVRKGWKMVRGDSKEGA